MTGPTHADKALARAHLVTGQAARLLSVAAIVAGVLAWARYGPLAGIVAGAACLWVARAAKAPMPPDLADKFR